MSLRLLVEHPAGYAAEHAYILEVLLGDFLGLDYRAVCQDRQDVRITLESDASDHELTLADSLFTTAPEDWLTSGSLPQQPLGWWDAGSTFPEARLLETLVPLLYGSGQETRATDGAMHLPLDIFGCAFYMLTRYEEAVVGERDEHGRFVARSSLAFQEGFLNRPVVNEYLEILWCALARLWPQLERKQRRYTVAVSHDVDWPLCTAGRPLHRALRTVAGDIITRKAPGTALRRARGHAQTLRGCPDADLCNTFDFIMQQSERHGLRSAFYFITDQPAGEIDGRYLLDDPWIRQLIGRIRRRGHEIGLHPSYNSYDDPAQTRREYGRLRAVTDELGLEQERWGGRQHFLRWKCPATWQNWEDAGLDYDSTLAFSDAAGFRCGVCYDYPVFNLHTRERLKLREHPLIAMEVTLTGYMGLTWEGAAQAILKLSDVCRRFDGEFTLLWHNNLLVSAIERRTYAGVLEGLVA